VRWIGHGVRKTARSAADTVVVQCCCSSTCWWWRCALVGRVEWMVGFEIGSRLLLLDLDVLAEPGEAFENAWCSVLVFVRGRYW